MTHEVRRKSQSEIIITKNAHEKSLLLVCYYWGEGGGGFFFGGCFSEMKPGPLDHALEFELKQLLNDNK